MVAYQAINSFIVGDSVAGMELNNYFFCSLSCQHTFVFTEIEDIARLSKELKIGLHFRCISYC